MRLPGDTRRPEPVVNGDRPNRFVRRPAIDLLPLVPPAEQIVWDPIMNRYVPESEVYVVPTPPGEKKVTPWHQGQISEKYKHFLGIPAYQEPKATTKADSATAQTDATTLGGIVQVKWFYAKAETGKDIYIDWRKGSHQFCILKEDKTIHLVNPYSGLFTIAIWQDETGDWTLTWDVNHYTGETLDDTKPVVYWPSGATPIMTATAGAHDMYSFAWLPFANAGIGAYEGMATQDMRIPST